MEQCDMADKRRQNIQRKENVASRSLRAMESIVQENITKVAALAWAGYQHEGRGIVMFTFDTENTSTTYHGIDGEAWEALKLEETFPEVKELITEYDPKTQVVVLLATPKEASAYIIAEMHLPPPLAHQQRIAD
jgi:hypothetical protein